MSAGAGKRIRQEIRSRKLPARSDKTLGKLGTHVRSAERTEEAKLKALKQAARQGWADVSAARYADVADDRLEDFVGLLGRRAARLAKTAS